jgi:acyl-coenzyme A synthetase/AMP-(fatty) acid ligase
LGSKIASVRCTSTASTAYELLSRANAANPTGTAITYIEDADTLSTSKLTHAEFIARLHQMAHLFRELGVGRHDVVSILSPNVTDALVAFFAAETVGIANPINFLLRSDEVEAMMRAVGSKVLVTIGPEAPDLWSKAEHMRKSVPSLAHIVTIGVASGDAISLRTVLNDRPTAAVKGFTACGRRRCCILSYGRYDRFSKNRAAFASESGFLGGGAGRHLAVRRHNACA